MKKSPKGLGVLDVLAIIFIVLKLVGVISWKWVFVLLPIWIQLAIVIILLLIIAISD